MTFTRIRLMIVIMIAAALAACGGTAAPTATTAPVESNPPADTSGETAGNANAADSPAAAVENFYNALYTGGNAGDFVCSSTPELAAAYQSAADASASALAGATVDTSGLTYTVSEETAETASVSVAGEIVYTMSGVDTPIQYPATSINVLNVDGGWVVCGGTAG